VERRADASAFCDCGAERHGHLRGSASPVLRGILGTNPQHYRSGCFGCRSKTNRSKPPITSPSKPRRGSAPPSDSLAPPRRRRRRAPVISIADDEAGVGFLNGPGRRESARHIVFCYYRNRSRRAALTPASGGRVSSGIRPLRFIGLPKSMKTSSAGFGPIMKKRPDEAGQLAAA